jgi:hypothetical protein
MNPGHSFYDNYNATGFIQSLHTFTPAPAGTHDQPVLESNHNHGVNQEQNQPYFPARIKESPFPIDQPLGDNFVPSNQSVSIGMIHFL